MNKTEKIGVFIIGIFVSLNLYYSFTTGSSDIVLNPNPWNNFPDEEHWIKINNLELSAYRTEVSLFNPKNRFGLTYSIGVKIRYNLKNKHRAELEVDKLKLLSYNEYNEVSKAQFIPNNLEALSLENYLILIDGVLGKDFHQSKFEPNYAIVDGASIQFYTSFFPKKILEFADDEGNQLLIKTNPLLLFQSEIFQNLLFAILILITMILVFMGYWANWFFLLSFTLLLIPLNGLDYLFWYFLLVLFITPIFIRIKVRSVILSWLYPVVNWKIGKWIILTIFLGIFAYIYDWNTPFNIGMLLYVLMASVFWLIMGWLTLWATTTSFYSIYMYYKFPKVKVKEIEFSNIKLELVGASLREFPTYTCDVLVNNKIRLNTDTNSMIYLKLKKGKEVKVSYYQTDRRGNYIFT